LIKKIDSVLLFLVLCIFTLLKIDHLSIAFYWDESWVYAPAIKMLYQHGVSILPNAIPVDFSRGHPLLFHAAYVLWMKVFGPSNYAMHSFALGISLSLVVVLFRSMYLLFGRYLAWFSVVLLLTAPGPLATNTNLRPTTNTTKEMTTHIFQSEAKICDSVYSI
jgi:hypothetical protein